MATDRQTAANRANAAHSTGPRTPEGKTASKYNRLTHGLDSASPVVPGESAAEWAEHRAGIVDSLAPVGPLETELADRAALIFWRLRRVARYEVGAATAALDHAVGTLTGEFDPADPVQGTFGRVSPVAAPYSVAGLRNRLAAQQAELDRQCACTALLRDLPGYPDDRPIPGLVPGQLLDGICEDECVTSITDLEVVVDLKLPDEAWDDLIGWDGWTAGTVRAALAAVGKHAERTTDQLFVRAERRLAREAAAQREEIARLEDALARAEADVGPAVELVRKTNLLPELSTDKVIRYEAHLSRQLTQTLQLLDRAQAARAGKRLRPPVADGWEPGPVSPVGWAAGSTERTQPAAERPPMPTPFPRSATHPADRTQNVASSPPVVVAEPVPPVESAAISADRSRSGLVGSPVAANERGPVGPRPVVSADRTQSVDPFPFATVVGLRPDRPEEVVGRIR